DPAALEEPPDDVARGRREVREGLEHELAGVVPRDRPRDRLQRREPVVVRQPRQAEQAGLEPGDVITEFNGQPIHTAIDVIAAVRSHAPNEECTVRYERDGEQATTKVTLGEEDDDT
ncbi:MAG: PDZ domain-containing protein, partial [Actinophytocola sp.]|nr:PDZ domain-containing protein [Actinophytocola sp.]